MEKINLLFGIDKNYVDKLIDVLMSINFNNDCFLNVFLMHDNLSDKDLNKISKFLDGKGELNPICFDNDICNFPSFIKYISKVTYYRLFFPFINKDVDKVLYLDCDLICNGNILDLYNMEFENNTFIACENMLIEERSHYKKIWNERLGLPFDNTYINAGVLLINVKKYREEVSESELIGFIEKYKNVLVFQDQDVINKYFYGKIKCVDNKYNYQINAVDFGREDFSSVIIHYSEATKPWDYKYENVNKALPYYNFLKKKNDTKTLELLLKYHSDNYKDLLLREYCNWRAW